MSHNQSGQLQQFFCDGCNTEHSGTGDFTAVWEDAKDDGWRCRKVDDEWRHYCPDCQSKGL